jgi:hypothetical protein
MRLIEFANADEQLALWKLISDSVWTAVRTQAEQRARTEAERAAQVKPKKRVASKRSASKSLKVPHTPAPRPLSKPQQLQQNPAPSAQTAQSTSGGVKQAQAVKANPLAKSTPPAVANSMGMKQSTVGTAAPQANLTNPRMGTTQPPQLKAVGTAQQVPQVGTPKATPTQQRQPMRPLQQVQQFTQKRQNVGFPR